MSPHEKLRWKVDHEKAVLVTNFERRGWARASEEENWPGTNWNIYWGSPFSIKQIFSPENGARSPAILRSPPHAAPARAAPQRAIAPCRITTLPVAASGKPVRVSCGRHSAG